MSTHRTSVFPPHQASSRSGKVVLLLIVGVALMAGSLAGWRFLHDDRSDVDGGSPDVHRVERGRFDVIIPASGELAALQQVEIVNQLESRAIITEIVPEGKIVRAGDLLFRLADEEIRTRIKDARDTVTAAEATLASARSNLAIRESSMESDIEKADLQIRLADLAFQAWIHGELPSRRQALAVAERTAKINFERLQQKFIESEKLLEDDHISKDEFERDRIAMIEAEARLQTAKLDSEVFEEYQFFQDEARRKSDLAQAKSERERVQARAEAEVANAKANLESAENRLILAQERLADLERQLTYCEVYAPSGGLVVYASSIEGNRRGNNDQGIQVGTELRPNETVIILPDTTQMVASIRVNEALVGQIRRGQPARVVCDALPTVNLVGEVLSVAVLAEQTGWRDPNRREFTVRVLLTNATEEMGLKPSMRCSAEVIVDSVADAVHVPIQAVFRRGGDAFVYVTDGRQAEQRSIRTGRASELEVEIVRGLAEGERVLLREPMPEEIRRAANGNGDSGRRQGGPPRRGLAGAN